jgi:hypothetical protein
MADELPGFIPQGLRLEDVSLLRADETVFNAMMDGWCAQIARGLAVGRVSCRVRRVKLGLSCDVLSEFQGLQPSRILDTGARTPLAATTSSADSMQETMRWATPS